MTDAIQKAREALRAIIDTLDAEEMGEGPPASGHAAHWQKLHDDGTAALAALDAETEVKVTRIDILREWFGGDRYARDYEYLDANFGEHADRIVGYLARARSPGVPVMSRLDEKGLEAARAAFYGPKGSVVAAISAYLAATTPADVGEEPVAWRWKTPAEDDHWVWSYSAVIDNPHDARCEPLYSATALERVTRERDEARATLDEVCLSSRQEWQRATSAEAKLAEALADRAAQAERMARLEEALRKGRA